VKKYIYLLLLAFSLLLSACASTRDLETAKRDFASKIDTLNSKITNLESQTDLVVKRTKELTAETVAIRQREADEGADITDIRDTLEELSGRIDVLEKDTADIKSSVGTLQERISFTEKYMDIGGKKAIKAVPDSSAVDGSGAKENTDSDIAYEAAFNSFKNEDFVKARTEFEAYLSQFPAAQKSADAYYWIGECYYFEDKLDQAILHFDKVVKNYPAADKVPRALLKEGICFSRLDDKITAKIIFQQVVQSYANTNEALIAQKKLRDMETQDKPSSAAGAK
jgi:tol-pal system protein YbgF